MNYGEELAYWYLRLNGFFPISNFVVHKSTLVKHTSDCDLVGIRPPHVYEEIGGKADDWDPYLIDLLDYERTIGITCEVKTGAYDPGAIFRADNLRYAIGRLGFVPQPKIEATTERLMNSSRINVKGKFQICKLLVANQEKHSGTYLFRELNSIRSFLKSRVEKYPIEKFRDRMFFGSVLFQEMIDVVALHSEQRGRPAVRRND